MRRPPLRARLQVYLTEPLCLLDVEEGVISVSTCVWLSVYVFLKGGRSVVCCGSPAFEGRRGRQKGEVPRLARLPSHTSKQNTMPPTPTHSAAAARACARRRPPLSCCILRHPAPRRFDRLQHHHHRSSPLLSPTRRNASASSPAPSPKSRAAAAGDEYPPDDQQLTSRRRQQQRPLAAAAAAVRARVAAVARTLGLDVATSHLLLSNTLSGTILVLGVLSSRGIGPVAAASSTAALLLANQASRPARLTAALALSPLAGRLLDTLSRRRDSSNSTERPPARARLAAAAALLCAQALIMLLALGVATAYAALAGA